MARAAPSVGSVPLPSSSSSTRLRASAAARMSLTRTMCPENVDRLCSSDWLSPRSASAPLNTTICTRSGRYRTGPRPCGGRCAYTRGRVSHPRGLGGGAVGGAVTVRVPRQANVEARLRHEDRHAERLKRRRLAAGVGARDRRHARPGWYAQVHRLWHLCRGVPGVRLRHLRRAAATRRLGLRLKGFEAHGHGGAGGVGWQHNVLRSGGPRQRRQRRL